MSLPALHANLKTQLQAHIPLASWSTTHFAKALTYIDGNMPVQQLRPAELPALILELGDGEYDPIVVGGKRQLVRAQILLAVVWHEKSALAAFAQRTALPELIASAVRADPTLSGAVAGSWLNEFQTDRGGNHPTHMLRFEVVAQYYDIST